MNGPEFDLSEFETGCLDGEIGLGQRHLLQLLDQQLVVPRGILREAVVGDHEGAAARLAQVVEQNRRHLAQTQLFCRQQAAVTGDDLQPTVDQNQYVEAEGDDAASQLSDLPGAVKARIGGIGSQCFDTPPNNRQYRTGRRSGFLRETNHNLPILPEPNGICQYNNC